MEDNRLYRVTLIYQADGMRRPLTFRHQTRADSGSEAVDKAISFISSAYDSGYETLSFIVDCQPVGALYGSQVDGNS